MECQGFIIFIFQFLPPNAELSNGFALIMPEQSGGKSLQQVIDRLNWYLKDWWNYFGKAEVATGFKSIIYWIVRRLRAIIWKQWKNYRTRVRELKKCGIPHLKAVLNGYSRKDPWRMSKVKLVAYALPRAYLISLGLFFL